MILTPLSLERMKTMTVSDMIDRVEHMARTFFSKSDKRIDPTWIGMMPSGEVVTIVTPVSGESIRLAMYYVFCKFSLLGVKRYVAMTECSISRSDGPMWVDESFVSGLIIIGIGDDEKICKSFSIRRNDGFVDLTNNVVAFDPEGPITKMAAAGLPDQLVPIARSYIESEEKAGHVRVWISPSIDETILGLDPETHVVH